LDALLLSFIAAALGQWGDKTQWLVADLAARYRRPRALLAGAALAFLANALIAGFAGQMIHGRITPRAVSLFVAMALAFAAVDGLIGRRPKPMAEGWRTGPVVTSLVCVFLIGFADKGQFVTLALSAQYDAPLLAAAGAAAGTIAASIPAACLGARFERVVPVRPIRIGVALIFLVVAFVTAVNALRLT
jgi:putative Ca2+/H+ antiporter (TMEM165/GDT1 family)